MSWPTLRDIGRAFRNLDPADVRSSAARPIRIGILALDETFYSHLLRFLIPADLSDAKAAEAARSIRRMATEEDLAQCDIGLSERGLPHPPHFFAFDPHDPGMAIDAILEAQPDLWLPLARTFLPFREPVIRRIIWKISKENAMFSVATSLPNIVPSVLTLPWAVGEFASDTAFLTVNQVRMAFLIAAASDADIGYSNQRAQIGSIITAAFGWRALARELISKVPAGGGLVSKGLVAFSGTFVVGKGIERYLRFGRKLTRDEKKRYYTEAFDRGRHVVKDVVQRVTGRTAAAHGA